MAKRIQTLTKEAKQRIRDGAVGSGILILKTEPSTILYIEVYTAPDSTLRGVGDGKPIFPITIRESDPTTSEECWVEKEVTG